MVTVPIWTLVLAGLVFAGILIKEYFAGKDLEDNLEGALYILRRYADKFGEELIEEIYAEAKENEGE